MHRKSKNRYLQGKAEILVKKAEQIGNITGCKAFVGIIPTWQRGKHWPYKSPDYSNKHIPTQDSSAIEGNILQDSTPNLTPASPQTGSSKIGNRPRRLPNLPCQMWKLTDMQTSILGLIVPNNIIGGSTWDVWEFLMKTSIVERKSWTLRKKTAIFTGNMCLLQNQLGGIGIRWINVKLLLLSEMKTRFVLKKHLKRKLICNFS